MKVNDYDVPENLYYNREHEWILIEKETLVRIGITDYAQKMLREIAFIYLPKKDITVKRQETFAVVESVKALSEIYSPFTGKIVEVNEKLGGRPRIINDDPYGDGWIVDINPSKFKTESKKLIKAKTYARYIKKMIKIDENLLIYRWKQQSKE